MAGRVCAFGSDSRHPHPAIASVRQFLTLHLGKQYLASGDKVTPAMSSLILNTCFIFLLFFFCNFHRKPWIGIERLLPNLKIFILLLMLIHLVQMSWNFGIVLECTDLGVSFDSNTSQNNCQMRKRNPQCFPRGI